MSGGLACERLCKGHLLRGCVKAPFSPLLALPPNRLALNFLLWLLLVVPSTSHHTLCCPEDTRKLAG